MMISPESFVESIKDLPFDKLIIKRDKLYREIRSFEKQKDKETEALVLDPSTEVVYQMNLEYLGKLFEFMSVRYRTESA